MQAKISAAVLGDFQIKSEMLDYRRLWGVVSGIGGLLRDGSGCGALEVDLSSCWSDSENCRYSRGGPM